MTYTAEQKTLQEFLALGLVHKSSISFAQSIATARFPTPKQLFYVKKLTDEVISRQPVPAASAAAARVAATTVPGTGFGTATPAVRAFQTVTRAFDDAPIFALFETAKKHMKFPKIRMLFVGNPLRLEPSKKYPDTIYLKAAGFGSAYYGKIVRGTGGIAFGADAKGFEAELTAAVTELSTDPVKVAQNYGKLTHSCCFCGSGLDTVESLAVGYGPVCAKHYYLPWGKYTPAQIPDMEKVVTLTAAEALNASKELTFTEADEASLA